jgi:hypothetical protein
MICPFDQMWMLQHPSLHNHLKCSCGYTCVEPVKQATVWPSDKPFRDLDEKLEDPTKKEDK